jgi:hypothetical protein
VVWKPRPFSYLPLFTNFAFTAFLNVPIGLQAAPKSGNSLHLLRYRLLSLLLPLEYAVQLLLARDHSTVGDVSAVGDLELRLTALPHRA